jgi:glycosyltransferase involved in cell wall biosynthesis
MENKYRLLRITTVPISLKLLLGGQLPFFQRNGYEVLAVSADGPEVSALQQEGIPHQVVPMTRKITPIQDLIALVKLVAVIGKFKPNIVHSHTPKAGLLGMLAAWLCGVPVRLHTVAGLPLMEATGVKKRILIFTEQITYRFASEVFVNSQGLMDYIQKNISLHPKIKVIGRGSSNGINTTFFKRTALLENEAKCLREQHGIRQDATVFCFVGRVVKDKGISELVQAFQQMQREQSHQKIHLLLVGPFEQELDPLSEADYNFITSSPSVILPGFQKDVRSWITASDIFVFPSYREGFPNVVMQASCLGVPCIVTDINGCNEIVKDQVTGLIVRPKDVNSLYEAMTTLMNDVEKASKLAIGARAYVAENFDQQYIWNLIKDTYERCLEAAKVND